MSSLRDIPVITADLPVSSTLSGNAYPMSIFKTQRKETPLHE